MIEWGTVMDHTILLNRLSKVGLDVSTSTLSLVAVPTPTSFPNNLSFYIGTKTQHFIFVKISPSSFGHKD